MDESFRGVDRRLVHHLHAAGNDARADDPRHTFAGRLDLGKADHQGARGLRLLQDAHRDLGDDAEQAFRTRDDSHQVVARAFGGLAADAKHFARHQHNLAPEHVVGGHAVFEAVHAARILRDVAADRARNLRRGIGRIIEAGMRHRLADGEIGDPGLRHHRPVIEIDLANALEFAEPQQHRVRQRRAGAARHHLDALLEAVFQHLRNLFRGVRQHHHHRRLAIGHQPIGLVGEHFGRRIDHALARYDGAERLDDGAAAPQNGLIRSGHLDGHFDLSAAGPASPATLPISREESSRSGYVQGTSDAGRANRAFHKVQVAPELPNSLSRPWAIARSLCHNGCVLARPEQKEPRMKKLIPSALIVLASTAFVPAALAQDADAGKNSFNKCLACHAIGEDAKNKVGPELNGLDGRKSGSAPDYNYSEANKNSGITWNEANFKEYIKDPKAKVPGTKMFFAGIKNETEVNNLWAYVSQFDADGKIKAK